MAPHSRKLPQTKLVVCCCQLGVWLGSREQLYSAQVAAASCQPQVVAPPSLPLVTMVTMVVCTVHPPLVPPVP